MSHDPIALLKRAYAAFDAWAGIDPTVEPLSFSAEADGRVAVDVRQVVRDKSGELLRDDVVKHVYRIESGLVRSMEIRGD